MSLYCITVNNVHTFCAFNFRTNQAIQKYFNNEIFTIYSTSNICKMLTMAVCRVLHSVIAKDVIIDKTTRLINEFCRARARYQPLTPSIHAHFVSSFRTVLQPPAYASVLLAHPPYHPLLGYIPLHLQA